MLKIINYKIYIFLFLLNFSLNILYSCSLQYVNQTLLTNYTSGAYTIALDYYYNENYLAIGKSSNFGFINNSISIYKLNNNGTLSSKIVDFIDNLNMDPYKLKYSPDGKYLTIISPSSQYLIFFTVNSDGTLNAPQFYNLTMNATDFAYSNIQFSSNGISYRTIAVLSRVQNTIMIFAIIDDKLKTLSIYGNSNEETTQILKYPNSIDYINYSTGGSQYNYLILNNYNYKNQFQPSITLIPLESDGSINPNPTTFDSQNYGIYGINIYSKGILKVNPKNQLNFALTDPSNNALYLFNLNITNGNISISSIHSSLDVSSNILKSPYYLSYSSDGKTIYVNNQLFGSITTFILNDSKDNFYSKNGSYYYSNIVLPNNQKSIIIKPSPSGLYLASISLENINNVYTPFIDILYNLNQANYSTEFNTPITINMSSIINNLCNNDENLSILGVNVNPSASNGSVLFNTNTNTLVYTPFNGFSGLDSFGFTVQNSLGNIANGIININVLPQAQAIYLETLKNTPLNIPSSILTKSGGSNLSLNNFTNQPLHGTNNYQLLYINNNNNSSAIIDYTAKDQIGDIANSILNINFLSVPKNLYLSTFYNKPIKIYPLKYIQDSTNFIIFSIIEQPAHGIAYIKNDYTIIYKPNLNYTGPDSFIIYLKDPGNSNLLSYNNLQLKINVYTQQNNYLNSLDSIYIARKYIC